VRISAVQMDCVSGDPARNCAKMLGFIERAAKDGAGIIVFPEMSDTGYDMHQILRSASTWGEEPMRELCSAAKGYGINVIAGLSERDGDAIYNSTAVIDRTGHVVGRYRKTHLITAEPTFEHRFIKPGDALGFAELESVPIGLMTCYDVRFPEVARTLALRGAKILFIPSAWPLVRLPHWTCLTAARAIENQVFVIAAGRVGTEAGSTFAGTSVIYNPYGVTLASASQIHERLITADIELRELEQVRGQIQVHRDRRPDLYQVSSDSSS
jgi:omega-amidase